MPFAIDEERFRKQNTFDVSAAPNSANGLPVKNIPVQEFPMAVYKHPSEPFQTIIHRNLHHEVVHEERVPTEHLAMLVQDKKELDKALKDGWVKDPYIAQAPENPNRHIYETKK